MMGGFVDLHCHWIPGIDDGATNLSEAVGILHALVGLGFERVIATPHMRPGLFDNTQQDLVVAFANVEEQLRSVEGLPARELSSEHFFDDVVFQRLLEGQALPYPGRHAVLLEFYTSTFPPSLSQLLAQLMRSGLLPVIAHPERYQPLWQKPEILEELVDAGAVALLDTAALVGKYGSRPQRAARELLERGLYHAACSDAHRPADVAEVERGMDWIRAEYGGEELDALFHSGPLEILEGTIPR